jgi:hypothetical protein
MEKKTSPRRKRKPTPTKLNVEYERHGRRWIVTITGPRFSSIGDGTTKEKALRVAGVGALHAIALMVERGELDISCCLPIEVVEINPSS